jgi:hypothetical protein
MWALGDYAGICDIAVADSKQFKGALFFPHEIHGCMALRY